MSEMIVEGKESKTAPCCYERPPHYDSSQPSQDLLTSVIENVQTARKLFRRMDDLDKEVANIAENLEKESLWKIQVEILSRNVSSS